MTGFLKINNPALKVSILVLLLTIFPFNSVFAVDNTSNQIDFKSFTGVYHLSRDKRGLSLLTTDETILADFPATGLTGIKRLIPEKFQDRSVGVKILNVTDAAGNPIPYKVQSDSTNLALIIGDPSITLSGTQTIRIKYQTSGVINLNNKANQLLLSTNGRGWESPFDSVTANLYIPKSFNSEIKGTPSCYKVIGVVKDNDCQVNTESTPTETLITTETVSTSANQGLILKVDFNSATFTNNHSQLLRDTFIIFCLLIIINVAFAYSRKYFGPARKR